MCINDPTKVKVDWSELSYDNEPNILLGEEDNKYCTDPTKIKIDWSELK